MALKKITRADIEKLHRSGVLKKVGTVQLESGEKLAGAKFRDYLAEKADGSLDTAASTALGTFTGRGLAAALGFGWELIPGIAIGANGKFVNQTLETVSGTGFMGDAGLLLELGPLYLGGGVQNLGSFGSYTSPMNLRGAGALRLDFMGDFRRGDIDSHDRERQNGMAIRSIHGRSVRFDRLGSL